MLGLAGSIVGILLGILLSYGLIGFSEQFLQTEVGWNLQIAPVYSGLVVGIIATTVFGFLPILAASRVRPNVLLQPQASALPKAGRLISLFVVLLLTAVMGLVATVFLDDLTIAMIGTYGALAVLTLLTGILLGVVWLVGKVPSFGSINLKLSLRGLSRQKGRGASTLLALVIGVFAMGSIVILSGSMKQLVDEFAEDAVGGNILLMVPDGDPEITERASQAISSLQGVTNVVEDYEYTAQLVAVNGEPKSGWGFTMRARRGTATEGNVALADGRHLVPEDVGSPVAVVGGWGAPERLGLRVGDELTFSVGGEWVYDEFMGGQEVTLELVGITLDEPPAQGAFEGGIMVPIGALDPTITPNYAFFIMTAPESAAPGITAQLTKDVPGAIAMETETVAGVFKAIIDRIAIFPTILSGLALFAGAVIIANSVALATMERRREIAMMKAVGAKGSRILTSLLIEYGVIGLVGGGIGVALSTIVLALFRNQFESEISAVPNPLSVMVVLGIAIAVALGAAAISAWPASKEKNH